MADDPKAQIKRRQWRVTQPRLDPDEAVRQGDAARYAWSIFENRDGAVAFLNQHHDGLGGRPIDLAISSADGLAAVKRAIDNAGQSPAFVHRSEQDRAAAVHGPASPTD